MSEKLRNLLIYGVLILLPSLVFAYSCGFDFLSSWDDDMFITRNSAGLVLSFSNIHYWLTHKCIDNYLPLTMFSYMFDFNLWGLQPLPYHIQNLFWHICAVLAVYRILLFFGISKGTSFFLAAVFAVHPQRVESVVWLSERKDVICGALYLWSVYFYLKKLSSDKIPLLSLFLFVGALMAKPMAISLPAILLCCEFYRKRDFDIKAYFLKLWPFFTLALAFVPITVSTREYYTDGLSIASRILTVLHNIPWYLWKTFLPENLSPVYPKVFYSDMLLLKLFLSYTLCFSIFFLLFRKDKRGFYYAALPLLFSYFTVLAPVIGFLPLGGIDYTDRYSYLPSVIILLALGLCMKRILPEKKHIAVVPAAFIVIVFLSLTTFYYALSWKNMYSICSAASIHEPPNPLPLVTLGYFELENKNYRRVFEISEKLKSLKGDKPSVFFNTNLSGYLTGTALYRMGETGTALKIFENIKGFMKNNTYTTNADYCMMLLCMAGEYLKKGENLKAASCYDEITLSPGNDEFRNLYFTGMSEYLRGNRSSALKTFGKLKELHPQDREIGKIYEQIKRSIEEK